MIEADVTDADLLARFVRGEQAALAVVVDRYTDMVYAAAMRQVRDHAMAEDVTQAVFILLADKAGKLRRHSLAGWLIKATRLTALATRRGETRRKIREQKAAAMKSETLSTDYWQQISQTLDESLSHLGEEDRTVVTLRYLQGREVAEVAAAMGTTPAAVSKRLSRAMAKLRKRFAKKDVDAPIAAIGVALLAHARMSGPSGLATRSFNAAVADRGTIANTAAGILAGSVTVGTGISTLGYSAIVFVLITLAAVSFHFVFHKEPAHLNLAASTGPIRVGVIVSQFTAEGPHEGRSPYGYTHLIMHRALRVDPMIELIPVLEPGTADQGGIPDILSTTFKGETPVDAGNLDELMTLDVIACPRVCDVSPGVLANIETAAKRGKGLLIWSSLGLMSPGPSPQVNELNAQAEGILAMTDVAIPCRVLVKHPLLGSLAAGEVVNLEVNGELGIPLPGAISLMEVEDAHQLHAANANASLATIKPGYRFSALLLSHLGKGKIITCQVCPCAAIPSVLEDATHQAFLIRSVKWLVDRPLD